MNTWRYRCSERLLPSLYVASDLASFPVDRHEQAYLADDLTQDDADRRRAYRRLDLRWYQWLYHQMRLAEEKSAAGQISWSAWESLRARFAAIWSWMRDRYEPEQLADAHAALPSRDYHPPILERAHVRCA